MPCTTDITQYMQHNELVNYYIIRIYETISIKLVAKALDEKNMQQDFKTSLNK